MQFIIRKNTTDVSVIMSLIDPTTNGPLTGATITDLDMTYTRPGAAHIKVDATALAAVNSAHADNKMSEIDSTDAKGDYRADWPDAVFADGVDSVALVIQDVAGRQVGRLDVSLINLPTAGAGGILVDHNTGGADNLAYQDGGVGIDNATVKAFLKADWDAGNRTSDYVKGQTTTDVNGRWEEPMQLDAATYTFLFNLQGSFGPDTAEQAVA